MVIIFMSTQPFLVWAQTFKLSLATKQIRSIFLVHNCKNNKTETVTVWYLLNRTGHWLCCLIEVRGEVATLPLSLPSSELWSVQCSDFHSRTERGKEDHCLQSKQVAHVGTGSHTHTHTHHQVWLLATLQFTGHRSRRLDKEVPLSWPQDHTTWNSTQFTKYQKGKCNRRTYLWKVCLC